MNLHNEFVKGNSLVLLIIVYLIIILGSAFLYITKTDTVINSCAIETSNPNSDWWSFYLKNLRGHNYFLDDGQDKSNNENCITSGWGISHFFMFFILGYLCPKLYLELFILGLIWEFIEYYIGCHCAFDILLNTGGLIFGVTLRNIIYPLSNEMFS